MTDTKERDLTNPAERFRTLETIGAYRWKDGRDIVVSVKDAGNGPAVDIREYVTRDAYTDADFDVIGKGRNGKPQKAPYMGPTKNGFWTSPDMAATLADALALASIAAATYTEGKTDA